MRTGSIRDGKVPTAVRSETEELYRAMGVPERVSAVEINEIGKLMVYGSGKN